MLTALLLIFVGLVGLIWSGDRFVAGASALARHLGIPPLLIGLTIVGIGTSAPEIFVSIVASIKGYPGLAVGNAIGSNITNMGLVLGFTALLIPIKVNSGLLQWEFPVLLGIMILVALLFVEGHISRIDGVVLLVGFLVVVTWMIILGLKRRNSDPMALEYANEIPTTLSRSWSIIWVILGLILLPLFSRVLVEGAVILAKLWGVSDIVIGLTIVAIGTSLPELFASLMGAIRNEPDIAIGNVLGSNMFNLLAVLGFPALIHPMPLDPVFFLRDYPVMLVLTILLYGMCFGKLRTITRWQGALLLVIYVSYLTYLVLTV